MSIDLYWVPLGAGTPVVEVSGRVFEAVSALVQRRPRCDLFHAAVELTTPDGRYAVEQAPVPDGRGDTRGVVATGPVCSRFAGRLRVFRYEVRCWPDGVIPDLVHAVDSPVRLTDDPSVAARVKEVLPDVPTPTWGRDELGTGEMWNSNSVVAWSLHTAGVDLTDVGPPPGGRAPGWGAGLSVASRRG